MSSLYKQDFANRGPCIRTSRRRVQAPLEGSACTLNTPSAFCYRVPMFERYTEQSRRAIFFARYEASPYGSPYIDTEHLLLGLLREMGSYAKVAVLDGAWYRAEIEKRIVVRERISTSVEVPLSQACKHALNFAQEEADAVKCRVIAPEHLLLGLLRVEDSLAAQLLRQRGIDPEALRKQLASSSTSTSSDSATEDEEGEEGEVSDEYAADKLAKNAKQTLDNFLEGLRSGRPSLFAEFFDDSSQFIDLKGSRWVGQEIEAHAAELFAPYATKSATCRAESMRLFSRVFIATLLWDTPARPFKLLHRMTVVMVADSGIWLVTSVQLTPIAES
jgi:Clp amino terminal domain, pathogenicity island component